MRGYYTQPLATVMTVSDYVTTIQAPGTRFSKNLRTNLGKT